MDLNFKMSVTELSDGGENDGVRYFRGHSLIRNTENTRKTYQSQVYWNSER